MREDSLEDLKIQLRRFAEERDWNKFHSPKNLSMALSVEVSEIAEHFQWLTGVESNKLPNDKLDEVETELADTLIYLIRLADKLNINLITAAHKKIEINRKKYPVDKVKGKADKYTEYEQCSLFLQLENKKHGIILIVLFLALLRLLPSSHIYQMRKLRP